MSAPICPPLKSMPVTREQLYDALADTTEIGSYAFPWRGFASWKDAFDRVNHYLDHTTEHHKWVPFNQSESSEGPMTLNGHPEKAFIERITNVWDTVHERAFQEHGGPMPQSPAQAAKAFFGINEGDLATMNDDELWNIAERVGFARIFVGDINDPDAYILDARDYGTGISASDMPHTILALHRGYKRDKPYCVGRHGQGSANTFQFSRLTLIASRRPDSDEIAFTVVRVFWKDESGQDLAVPVFKYLTVNGNIPTVSVGNRHFEPGTLVRHIGYQARNLRARLGERSFYGTMMRLLAKPILPTIIRFHDMNVNLEHEGKPVGSGWGWKRLIRGTRYVLDRAYDETKGHRPKSQSKANAKILYRIRNGLIDLGTKDYGGFDGVESLGTIHYNVWVTKVEDGKTEHDTVKSWVDPNNPILLTLHGQTHAEEARSFLTSDTGAGLFPLGRRMVVQLDCDGLTPRAIHDMFVSTREGTKKTPLRQKVMEELVHRLVADETLAKLNTESAMAPKDEPKQKEALADLLNKHLKTVGLTLQNFLKKVTRREEIKIEHNGPKKSARGAALVPIESRDPPTFINWRGYDSEDTDDVQKLYPTQSYSFLLETDAPETFWTPDDMAKSRIQISWSGPIRVKGYGEMQGGRLRVFVEVDKEKKSKLIIGSSAAVVAMLYRKDGQPPLVAKVGITIVPQANKGRAGGGPNVGDKGDVNNTKGGKKGFKNVIVEDSIQCLVPEPITQGDTWWSQLDWPKDTTTMPDVGFSICHIGGQWRFFYNACFPEFVDACCNMEKRGLRAAFIQRFEMNLALYGIFSLNEPKRVDEANLIGSSTDDPRVQALEVLRTSNRVTMRHAVFLTVSSINTELKVGKAVEREGQAA